MKKVLESSHAPAPLGHYSQGIEINNTIYLSGQIGINPETNFLVENLTAEADQIMNNIKAVLESANLSLVNIVKVTIYLKNMDNFQMFNEVYARYMKDNRPSRSCIAVAGLPKDANIEVDVIAVRFENCDITD